VSESEKRSDPWLQFDAFIAELKGIDISKPGWRRELEQARAARLDRQFADPYGNPLQLVKGGRDA
jgi:hypothetical protein